MFSVWDSSPSPPPKDTTGPTLLKPSSVPWFSFCVSSVVPVVVSVSLPSVGFWLSSSPPITTTSPSWLSSWLSAGGVVGLVSCVVSSWFSSSPPTTITSSSSSSSPFSSVAGGVTAGGVGLSPSSSLGEVLVPPWLFPVPTFTFPWLVVIFSNPGIVILILILLSLPLLSSLSEAQSHCGYLISIVGGVIVGISGLSASFTSSISILLCWNCVFI